ncbi:MAG TPA: rhodanese-like domain-containing protein [Steroidobacteraceae bacterium]|nr:rhodanese-like domain-containing protein [Steroidobacteraceae bacterium]
MRNGFVSAGVWVMLMAFTAAAASAADPPASTATAEAPAAPLPIAPAELAKRLDTKDPDLVILDVRTPEEFAAGHVPGARNVPHDQVASHLAELSASRDKQIVLYCRSGRRSALAADALRQAGFSRLLHLQGDYLAWEADRHPIERAK